MKSIALTCLIAAGTLALAACSTQPAQQSANQQKTAKNSDLVKVCTAQAPTGSHIKHVQCFTMTREQYKDYQKAKQESRKKALDKLQRMDKGQNKSCGGPNGVQC